MRVDRILSGLSSLLILTTFLWISSCQHEPSIPDNLADICFEREVLPIFLNSCSMTGCHDGNDESDLVLNNYLNISHAVEPGNPSQSIIYQAITARTGENRMPPDQPLSEENRTIIRLWIEQGAKLTVCPDQFLPPGALEDYVNPRACFSRDILPVLISSCAIPGCHDTQTHKEGYIFASYTTAMNAVKPGNPSDSKLYEVITKTTGEDMMPPSPYSRLSQANIDSIAAWIRYGALDEYCGEVCDTINPVTFSGTIWPVVQKYCTGCHTGSTPSGGILLNNYSNMQTIASNGQLIKALNGSGVPKMPPSGSFSACRIRQFEIWVNNGFLNN